MDNTKFEKQIIKTGFVLEHNISTALRRKGWSVISNKYYIDDNEETVREIDLIAYKATKVQHFFVYTALVISCKKNEANVWALLSRPLDKSNPNRNWNPVHAWTNDKALGFQLSQPDFGADYHTKGGEKVLRALADPMFDIFAFQEMCRQSGAPKNDKAIFNSVTSLMKAQAYELRALPTRKTVPSIYHFSLISVIDSEMIRLLFDGDDLSASDLCSEQYLANYIIDKKQNVSRIRFLRAKEFEETISDYDELHAFNCKVFSDYCDDFYEGVLEDWNRTKIFIEKFRKDVWWGLHWRIYKTYNINLKKETISLSWCSEDRVVAVTLPLEDEHLDFLNEDTESRKTVTRALESIYRYKGSFLFAEDDIPF